MHHSSIYFFSVDPEKAFGGIMDTEPIYPSTQAAGSS